MNKPNGPMLATANGAHTSIQPDTPMPDWITLHPKVTHTAYRLYAIMRALLVQKGRDGELWLSHDEISHLMVGQNGRPATVSTVKATLRNLAEVGLVEHPDGSKMASPTGRGNPTKELAYRLNETSRATQWQSASDKAGAYAPGWRTDHEADSGTVYLIGASGSSSAKIGVTGNLKKRLASFRYSISRDLEVLWSAPGGLELEGWLHRQFHDARTHGEWFDFGDLDPVATVAAKAAQFDGGAAK